MKRHQLFQHSEAFWTPSKAKQYLHSTPILEQSLLEDFALLEAKVKPNSNTFLEAFLIFKDYNYFFPNCNWHRILVTFQLGLQDVFFMLLNGIEPHEQIKQLPKQVLYYIFASYYYFLQVLIEVLVFYSLSKNWMFSSIMVAFPATINTLSSTFGGSKSSTRRPMKGISVEAQ